MNPTTDPQLRSFLPVAVDSHFPIQNLPYTIFQPCSNSMPRAGVAIGDWILDLGVLESERFFVDILGNNSSVFRQRYLNTFMAKDPEIWHNIRVVIQDLLKEENPSLRENFALRKNALVRQKNALFHLAVDISDFTDFYSSREHATNVGKMFRNEKEALLPNWLHLPVAYHARASSIVLSGTDIVRPRGQVFDEKTQKPVFTPTESLDFELEMGFFVGPGNPLGEAIPVEKGSEHLFGMVLLNDWSARDIQKWEYQPLGPFLGKNFATSVSPWIVPMEALEPFKCAAPKQDPAPLPYLKQLDQSSYDINLEVRMRAESSMDFTTVSQTNYRHLYWDIYQQIAHHTINGCNLKTGDLIASGTISGSAPDSLGSMLELTWNGSQPISLFNGDKRKFLNDGDTVTITGWCQGEGYRVGFGEVTGKILPVK